MKNNQYLTKLFEDLYLLEKQARDLYESFLVTLTGPEEIKIITEIKNDEIKHMEIAKKLQNLVKNEN